MGSPTHVYAYGCKTVRAFCYFFEDCSLSWGWGGVGGHVNVPRTSYRIYCDVAKISGILYYVTCCYAAGISEIVSYVTCCYAAEILGTFLLRDMLLRC